MAMLGEEPIIDPAILEHGFFGDLVGDLCSLGLFMVDCFASGRVNKAERQEATHPETGGEFGTR